MKKTRSLTIVECFNVIRAHSQEIHSHYRVSYELLRGSSRLDVQLPASLDQPALVHFSIAHKKELRFNLDHRNRGKVPDPASWPLVFGGNHLERTILVQFFTVEHVGNDYVARVY